MRTPHGNELSFAIHRPSGHARVREGMLQIPSRDAPGLGHDLLDRPLDNQLAAAAARPGADVDHVVGPPDRILVVLDHDHAVALVLECNEARHKPLVVPRMQPDRRLIEHVAHALQVAAELRGKADALRFAAREARRVPVQGKIPEPHLAQEHEARDDLLDRILAKNLVPAGEANLLHGRETLVYAHRGDFADRPACKAHGAGHGIEPCPLAFRTDRIGCRTFKPPGLLSALLAVKSADLAPGAKAGGTPAHLAVVGKEPRIGFGKALAAHRAGALCREGPSSPFSRSPERLGAVVHAHDAVPVGDGLPDGRAHLDLPRGLDHAGERRHLDRVLLIPGKFREGRSLHPLAVDLEVRDAPRGGALGLVRVDALAVHDNGSRDRDEPSAHALHDGGKDRLEALACDRLVAPRAVLHAELRIEQAQKVMHLGERSHGGLAPAPAGSLLDRHRGRDAHDALDVGLQARLHERARIGVERRKVAPLSL